MYWLLKRVNPLFFKIQKLDKIKIFVKYKILFGYFRRKKKKLFYFSKVAENMDDSNFVHSFYPKQKDGLQAQTITLFKGFDKE